jgi:hypothetical protein
MAMTDAARALPTRLARRMGFSLRRRRTGRRRLVGAAIAFVDKDDRLLELGAMPSITLAVAAGCLAGLALVAQSYRATSWRWPWAPGRVRHRSRKPR